MQDVLLCMQEISPLVSIVIPAYNAEKSLKETIDSIRAQSVQDWEIVIVDDGSTDNTASIATAESDKNIKVLSQQNAGVSVARNNGFRLTKGKYVIFFDADDLMGTSFIEERVKALENDQQISFACGWIETFPGNFPLRKGAVRDPQQEIFSFDPEVATVPSNYMIRSSVMREWGINFNPNLSSTADRFFLLQLSSVTHGCIISSDRGRLLYRVSPDSMSHKINSGLVFDNLSFYHEVRRNELMPKDAGRFKSLFFFSLALGFAKVGKPFYTIVFMSKAALSHPIVFAKMLFRRIKRIFAPDQ